MGSSQQREYFALTFQGSNSRYKQAKEITWQRHGAAHQMVRTMGRPSLDRRTEAGNSLCCQAGGDMPNVKHHQPRCTYKRTRNSNHKRHLTR